MKAVVHQRYGDPSVLRCIDIEPPVPEPDEVVVRVIAAALNPMDWHFMRGSPWLMRLAFGLRAPKETRRGADLAGRIDAVGVNVTLFKPGDEVFGFAKGAFAELATSSPARLAAKPRDLSWEEAAGIPIAGCTALQALRDRGHLQSGQEVLINGAAGGVGTFAVQIAKALGARVSGVCSSRNVELVRSLGAETVIDYSKESYLDRRGQYDLILDTVGNHPLGAHRRCLKERGVYVGVGGSDASGIGSLIGLLQGPALSAFGKQKFGMMLAKGSGSDLASLAAMSEAGTLRTVIDRRYSLDEVQQAMAYLEAGHARGKVILTVTADAGSASRA